jgi:DHA1 family tetracycline resistance protein-like MFS transporter
MNGQSAPLSQQRRRAAVVFIFITVVIDVRGCGIVIPVLPKLVQQFMGGDAAHGATMFGVFGTVWALMQFFFSPLLGAVSDRFGRRPVILISAFGLGLDYIVMALAPNIGWLLFGRVISGICAASFSTAGAYIADVAPPEKRAAAYGTIGAAFGVGFVLGPALGGVLGDINPRLPFWGAAALALVSAFYGLFVLPESLAPEKRDVFSWKKANPVGSLTLLRSHHELLGLASVNLLFQLAHCVLPSMYVLYTSYRYNWDTKTVGLTLMATRRPGEASDTTPRRARLALHRLVVRHRRFHRLRPGTDALVDVGVAAGVLPDGIVWSRPAEPDVTARPGARAGQATGRDWQHYEHRWADRPRVVHPVLRSLH